VVFCRYIATAHYLAEPCKRSSRTATVKAVTGELTPDEREAAVEQLGDSDVRILVATDCLSEGVNLQRLFTAVVHYDLSWNPTRHEQREGRVDRFGQKAREVRSTMLYGEDNPVDGAVLQVILRKAESIRKELGVLVPMPDDEGKLTQALMNAVLLRKGTSTTRSRSSTYSASRPRRFDRPGRAPSEKAKRRTARIFAQRRLKPEDVLPEWRKSAAVLGGEADVERFVSRAAGQARRTAAAGQAALQAAHRAPAAAVQERLAAEGLSGTLRIDFHQPAAQGALHSPHAPAGRRAWPTRCWNRHSTPHPRKPRRRCVARAGAAFVSAVSLKTTVLLLRMRHQLTVTHGTPPACCCARKAVAVAATGSDPFGRTHPRANPPVARRRSHPQHARPAAGPPASINRWMLCPAGSRQFGAIAKARAQALLQDHRRVREAAEGRGSTKSQPACR
jgi:hypothetical protein